MKITVNTVFECENMEEYEEAIDSIEQEIADMKDLNAMTGTNDSLEIVEANEDKLLVTAVAIYNK